MKRRITALKRASISLGCGLVALCCGSDPSTEQAEPVPGEPLTTVQPGPGRTIDYHLDWSWQGATQDAASGSYEFVTDLGYELRISRAYATSYSMAMVPCESADEATTGWLEPLGRALGPPSAFANHATVDDSSLVAAGLVESMFGSGSVLGRGTASGETYCELHYVALPMNESAPDGFALDGVSVHLEGEYRAPESADWQPLTLKSNLTAGTLVSLEDEYSSPLGLPQLTTADDLVVTLTRYPVPAFDGLPLDRLDAESLGFGYLKQLIWTSSVAIEAL